MATLTQAANLGEKALGHGDNAITEQNMTNPARDRQKYGDPSGETMKALCWMGKNDVQVGTFFEGHLPPYYSLLAFTFIEMTHAYNTPFVKLPFLSPPLSNPAMSFSRSQAPLSAAAICISTTALLSRCKKATSWATSSVDE